MDKPRPYIIVIISAFTLGLFLLSSVFPELNKYPDDWVFSPIAPLNQFINGFVESLVASFKAIGWLLEWPIKAAQKILVFFPWSLTTAIFVTLAFIASGIRLSIFVLISFLYMAAIGYWDKSLNSLAIVLVSVPIALATGFIVGVIGGYSSRARLIIMPALYLLQIVPAFVYLLPIVILFGFGTAAGLVASILYAFPPMARSTILGLGAVPQSVIEAGMVFGATGSQLFWKVRLPAAKSQILSGINQTTMAALSMVIIASIIGDKSDIGWEILSTIRDSQLGESILVGIVVALMAIVLNRITSGFAPRDKFKKPTILGFNAWFMAIYAIAILVALSLFFPMLNTWPETLTFNPALAMNPVLKSFVISGSEWLASINDAVFFFVMLPIKTGLPNAITLPTWGFEFSQPVLAAYICFILSLVIFSMWKEQYTLASVTVLIGVASYIGLTNLPWLAFFVIIIYCAYIASGFKLALGATVGLAFLLISGIWPQAVISLYLLGVAVLFCFLIGTAIGIIASESNFVSAIIRPILDTLQTMPLFVILIPFVIVFKVDEFTALLAIIAYAIVPAIRHTEYGLRNLPKETIEAAKTIGVMRWQLLMKIKLPLALPAIMLGLNRTFIYGIGMLVITSLVGANGLEQEIYSGLSDANFGVGVTAGIGIVIIAAIGDHMTHAISRRKHEEYELETAKF